MRLMRSRTHVSVLPVASFLAHEDGMSRGRYRIEFASEFLSIVA